MLAAQARRGTFWHWFLTHPALTTLGRYSYGIYVYHQLFGRKLVGWVAPQVSWAGPYGSSLLTVGIGILASLAVAAVSFHLFESPFLGLKSRFRAEGTVAGPSASDRVHQPLRLDEPGGVDLVPLPFLRHRRFQGMGQDLVG